MNEYQVMQSIESFLPPETIQGGSEQVVINSLQERLLDALSEFLIKYVDLPSKDIVMAGFQQLVEKLLSSASIGPVTRVVIKGALMVAASQLYDLLQRLKAPQL